MSESPTGKEKKRPHNIVMLGFDRHKAEPAKPVNFKVPEECPIVRQVKDCSRHRMPVRVFLDSYTSVEHKPVSAIELHPDVFADNPRIDFLHLCKQWQKNYREVDYSWEPTRAEMGKGHKKPWPQKGLGKAQQGSSVGPHWKGGGIAHGPRGPKALYQEILPNVRLRSLTSALSIKYFQEDLFVLKDFEIPSAEQSYLENVLAARGMESKSVLLVFTEKDNVKEADNICSAVKSWPQVNLIPLVGLNMWSILKHDKLVLTLSSVEELETKILWEKQRYDWIDKPHNFYRDLPFEINNNVE